MIRCVRMWTGADGNSHFEEGVIDLAGGERGDILSSNVDVAELSFRETKSGGSFEWHRDPIPRFVITLTGTLEFETRGGETFIIRPGDILLASMDELSDLLDTGQDVVRLRFLRGNRQPVREVAVRLREQAEAV